MSAEMRPIKNERKTERTPNKQVGSEGEKYSAEPTRGILVIPREWDYQEHYECQDRRGRVTENGERVILLHRV